MNSTEMEAVLETARGQARSIANQIISSAKTVEQRVAALHAITVMTAELLDAVQSAQGEVEAEKRPTAIMASCFGTATTVSPSAVMAFSGFSSKEHVLGTPLDRDG